MSNSVAAEPVTSQSRSAWFWIRTWAPVLLGMLMIGGESTEMLGSDHTSGPLRIVYEWFFGPVTGYRWFLIHHAIRKTGHFFGYGFIGLAWLRAWWFTLPRSRFFTDFVLALLGTAAIASCDEFHQAFLPNRTGTPWDVLLDCAGAFLLMFIVYIYMRVAKPKQLAREA